MKKINFITLLLLLFANTAMAGSLLALQSDKSVYHPGEKAALTGQILVTPADKRYRFFVKSSFMNQMLKVARPTQDSFVGMSPELTIGVHAWQVDLFLEETQTAEQLSKTIRYFEREIEDLSKELETETDPAKREALSAHVQRDHASISVCNERLWDNRRWINGSAYLVNVVPVSPMREAKKLPDIVVLLNQEPARYRVGDVVRATSYITRSFYDDVGVHENLVRFYFSGQLLATEAVTDVEFAALAPSTHVGEYRLAVDYFTRPKAQAEYLRNVIAKLMNQRADLIKERDLDTDPLTIERLNQEILEIEAFIAEYYRQLEAALIFRYHSDKFYEVLP